MGALRGEYRWPVSEIRDATWDDLEAVFALLDARSRAAFGISAQKAEHLRQDWKLPGGGRWVAVAHGSVVGYVALGERHDLVHAAVDPDVGDALLAHVEREARHRGFHHVAATAVPEDVPLYEALLRNGYGLDREILRMWRPLNGNLPDPVWPD